jgi:hypothetical protein
MMTMRDEGGLHGCCSIGSVGRLLGGFDLPRPTRGEAELTADAFIKLLKGTDSAGGQRTSESTV